MGIRFACPNGHALHVKAELAGRRGICPQCQAKFLIPSADVTSPSVQPATHAANPGSHHPARPTDPSVRLKLAAEPAAKTRSTGGAPASQRKTPPPAPHPAASSPSPAEPVGANVGTPLPPGPANETVVWYLRPPTGGQFGPANDALLQQWVAEGRVAADALVWRTGWSDWRRAEEVDGLLAPPAAQELPPSPFEPSVPTSAPSSASLATARIQQRKKRAAQAQMIAAIVLIVLAIALAGVLVVVLNQPAGAPDGESSESPAATIVAPAEDGPADEAAGDEEEPPASSDGAAGDE